jgi:hypothetical protein
MTGILAVWNDRADAIADDYERWYMGEHIPERLGVPGFRTARRYEAIDADRRFFTFYEVDSPNVLTSPAYLARLGSPTELTRTIMPNFLGMIRSLFVEKTREGSGAGGAAVVLRYANSTPADLPRGVIASVPPAEILGARVWHSAPDNKPADTAESRTRPQPDQAAGGAIVIETARVAIAQQLAAALKKEAGGDGSIGCYRLLCALSN